MSKLRSTVVNHIEFCSGAMPIYIYIGVELRRQLLNLYLVYYSYNVYNNPYGKITLYSETYPI
jgi:hypothetical protein